ncbi:Stk1 family PASTA domain-containing Ser/Thr kinase [Gemmiger formicilis]|uniref:Stk1 family PASTA domain-containing Ser/Thr kinase n=1 Tax=Gemmiger formicilis TaxID=745368 RepID=UPI00195A8A4E|nr:Stk1 family PASTA domain-containing Ser/Thr kinase [Gemmiger formicilis]MBM6900325.1 Stk1 family PASTA domain-containing Ser/Thr kinase [Gemmiger formicilis]
MDKLIGKRLDGRYLIQSLVGVGGMANVYRGVDEKTGNAIAVKVLKEEFLDNEELVRRFKNESKAISILDHPNIVKVYDVSVTDRLQYIVMEYVDGITLKEYLKQRGGALTWKETVHFATQVLGALQHAHSKGIIHRDVKPQNIMLLADGSIKMMDFGIARFSRAQSQTVSDKAIGSVHYISPEQAKGDKTDARTDLYSVGVMLYEMLSGRLPFDGDGAVSIAIMQISDKAKPLAQVAPNVPEGLRQITEKAMEKDPAKRYQSAQEMLDAIEEFKHNPSVRFEYEYRNTQDNPEKSINRVVNNAKAGAKGSNIRTGDARRVGTSNPGRSKSGKKARKDKKPFSLLPIFFGMAVAFVIGAAILIYLIFTNSSNLLFSNRADVTIINFVGMTLDEYRASEYNTLLKLQEAEEYNSTYPAGTIIRQNPKAGRTVKEGQKITLTVSLGTQYVTIPETKNMVAEDAEQTLKDMGLNVLQKPMQDNTVANGAVIYTSPAAGETVEGDSTVILYVSRAVINNTNYVPSVTGKTLEDAKNDLKVLNFSVRTIEQASTEPAGTVLSQSPAAGTEAKVTTIVTLVVSTGVPETPAETPAPSGGGIQESTWWSSDGSHQITQRTDGTMWNENGVQCDAEGNPIA